MSGKKKSRSRKNRINTPKIAENSEMEDTLAACETDEDGHHENSGESGNEAETLSGLQNISKEIRGLKSEMKEHFSSFGETLRHDMKADFENLEIDQRFTSLATEQQQQHGRVTEAESRVEKLERWAQEAHEALLLSLKQQKVLQEKLTDQESR